MLLQFVEIAVEVDDILAKMVRFDFAAHSAIQLIIATNTTTFVATVGHLIQRWWQDGQVTIRIAS